jgi:cytochrome c oxidase assembly protein subunit 16
MFLRTKAGKRLVAAGSLFIMITLGTLGLMEIQQVKYDTSDSKKKQISKDEALGLDKKRVKFDIQNEYFKLLKEPEREWDMVRLKRPEQETIIYKEA